MKLLIICLVLILGTSISAQKSERFACSEADAVAVKQYFYDREENNKLLSDFYATLKTNRNRLPFCWHGCVVRLVKPYYPDLAIQNRLSGSVTVETIADETGRIIYARAIDGPAIFKRGARQAACRSSFKPVVFSGKPIKFRWNIVYNFIL